ncbi:MAG: NADH:ubiquinone reductase (Na(+)-transporting) subunit C [Bacteroidetes bacterium]|nr:NADH:ubiquinone reductase (Na(+)-transporting) subunit C [Bacteroidota bacterium]
MYSNKYIFLYASAMVVIVAVLLSVAATVLTPFQEKNVRIEKMQNILSSMSIESTKKNAEDVFAKHIIESKVVNYLGEAIPGDAFEIDLLEENRKDISLRRLPLFVATLNSDTLYVIPLHGAGLWGPIWGYVSLKSDLNTIMGANFDHASETPGLGAEISTPVFESQFTGKKLYDNNGVFRSVKTIRGGADVSDNHGVDGISGGTITSNGLSSMLEQGLKVYEPFFKKLKDI